MLAAVASNFTANFATSVRSDVGINLWIDALSAKALVLLWSGIHCVARRTTEESRRSRLTGEVGIIIVVVVVIITIVVTTIHSSGG